ncbi:uncharacterized protein [Drosophila kikkawai]|uniref:Uncharacterized protein isoform X3 n=1 Tax=Drosophila kikkawai TaxID=30033 RepID=A0A6P4IPA5_DROKI|nr:uncharacterized protein LOC108076366 isoform X2 [Drosophila kikkawai]
MPKLVGNLMQVLIRKSKAFFQGNQNTSRHLYEKARGKENIHFLKLQREQLKMLRDRILSQKNEVISEMIKVDTKIQSLEKANPPDQSNKFKISDN